MPIQVIAVGKQREPFSQPALEFQRRLGRYCKLSIRELQDEKDPGSLSQVLAQRAVDMEGERILACIKAEDIVVALCIEGHQMDSLDFTQQIKAWHNQSTQVCFVIGGSLGLSEAVLRRADYKLSFSRMTFPHQLARVMLLEQIYRAYKIISGERYHK